MIDPVMIAIAAALAGKAAEGLFAGVHSAWGKLLRLVKDRSSDDPVIYTVLTSAQHQPQDQKKIDRLGEVLQLHAQHDPVFNEQLRLLWEQARRELYADHGGTVNEVSGTVSGHIVQARDIQGDITFGHSAGS